MPTIDLGALEAADATETARTRQPATGDTGAGDARDPWAHTPRRVGLTLPELRLLAEAVGAPLPFDLAGPGRPGGSAGGSAGGLAARLGPGASATQDEVYAAALARLGDPAESLRRRGLLLEAPDPGIAGALGLLAAPRTAVDLDVAAGPMRAHAWHRQRDGAVASLATADGLVFELAWFAARAWPAELARVAALPEELRLRASLVPAVLRVPWQVADAAAEAVRSGRPELVPVIAGGSTLGTALTALAGEAQGRLRALVSVVDEQPRAVGVASWTLLADGWHAVRARHGAGAHDDGLEIAAVTPTDLPTELAPLLAEVA